MQRDRGVCWIRKRLITTTNCKTYATLISACILTSSGLFNQVKLGKVRLSSTLLVFNNYIFLYGTISGKNKVFSKINSAMLPWGTSWLPWGISWLWVYHHMWSFSNKIIFVVFVNWNQWHRKPEFHYYYLLKWYHRIDMMLSF